MQQTQGAGGELEAAADGALPRAPRRVLSCYDRIIVTGTLPGACYAKGMTGLLSVSVEAFAAGRKLGHVSALQVARQTVEKIPTCSSREGTMRLRVETIRSGFVAEILGIDISRPVSPAAMAVIWEASDAHAVLVFRGQRLTDAEQIAFARNFGQPERYVFSYSSSVKLRLENPEMVYISNLDAVTNKPQAGLARHRMANLGNRLWHTDSSFRLPRGGSRCSTPMSCRRRGRLAPARRSSPTPAPPTIHADQSGRRC